MRLHPTDCRRGLTTGLLALGFFAASQTLQAQAPTFQVTQNFSGFFNIGNSGFIPPDTMGAVGPTQYGELVNGGYGIFSKTGAVTSTTTDLAFWQAAGLTTAVANGVFDPRLQYDAGSGHWYASELAFASNASTTSNGTDNQILVAVSKSSDLTQGFTGYAFDTVKGSTKNYFADFDTLGVNANGVYVGLNNYDSSGAGQAVSALAIDKSSLIAGTPVSNLSYNVDYNTTGFTPHPVTDSGTDTTAYFLSDYNVASGGLAVSAITGTTGTLTGSGQNVTAAAYADPPGGTFLDTQQGTATQIYGGDTRFSGSVIKVGNIIYGVQSVQDPGSGALQDIRLVGINATTKATVLDQLISNTDLNYSYPSLAINASGKVVIGFSSVGALQYISGNAIVGQLNAAGNAVIFGNSVTLAAGLSTYDVTFGGAANRWGDYSSTTIDPTNPNKFWTIQEYASATDEWSTNISEITVDAVPEASSALGFGLLLTLGGAAVVIRKRRAKA